MTNVNDFQRESHRIDQLIWDAMSLVAGERVLFCGYGNDGAWVRRAIEVGVDVTVIESAPERLTQLADARIPTLRGSTTQIPARDATYDAVVSFHYLHEIDPTFHTQIVSELARVARRIVVVEPAPPADALGKRIAELYLRAKYEAGAFEEYQTIDYWRKLLTMVKADVLMQQFTFTRLAPRFAINQTVELILEAMAIEELPQGYLEELRELAKSPDAQLSPLSRFVLVALPAGEAVRASAGTLFRKDAEPAPAVERVAPAAPPPVPPPPRFADALAGAEFPPVLPPGAVDAQAFGIAAAGATLPVPPAAPAAPAMPAGVTPNLTPAPPPPGFMPPQPAPEPAFGLPDPDAFGIAPPAADKPAAPFGSPFALPDDPDPFGLSPDPAERAGFGWTWEPPEGATTEDPPPFGIQVPPPGTP